MFLNNRSSLKSELLLTISDTTMVLAIDQYAWDKWTHAACLYDILRDIYTYVPWIIFV